MFINFKYFVLIISLNHCCGASNLIPTAIYSPQGMYSQSRHHFNAGPMKTGATNYYPIYALPLGPNPSFGELQYSASIVQPKVELMRTPLKNLVNYNYVQKQRTVQKPVDIQKPSAQVEMAQIPTIRYMPTRVNQRQHESQTTQQFQTTPVQYMTTQSKPILTVNHKSLVPMVLKAQLSATTLTPMTPNSLQMSTNTRPLRRQRVNPEIQMNSTVARVHSIRFNWPKSSQQNITQNIPLTQSTPSQGMFSRDVSQFQTEVQPIQSTHPNSDVSQRQKYSESKQNLRYNPTIRTESTYTPTAETEIYRETTPQPTVFQTTFLTTQPDVREIRNQEVRAQEVRAQEVSNQELRSQEVMNQEVSASDKKEKLSSVDSELNYQTQYYESEKTINPNYDNSGIIGDPIPQYDSPLNDNTGITLPENEVNYSHQSPEPEPVEGEHYLDNEREYTDGSIEGSSGPELKSLLEQFIQQLDLLKFVAAKELHKTHDNYKSKGDGQLTQHSVIEPSISKTITSYDEYQNERSFEQNLSNSESKNYKDTYDKSGRKYPCKKPFHAGALPNIGYPRNS